MDINLNDKDMEKLGSSVTARPSDNLAYLPLKKRRPRLRSPSPPPPSPPPPPPPPPQTPLDGLCAPHYSASDPEPLASNSLIVVQRSQVIEPLASVAYKNNTLDDVHNAEVGVNQEKSTPHDTDTCMDMSSSEKSTTDASNSLVEVQKSQSIENALVKTNISCFEDSFASVACKKNNDDNVHSAEIAVKQESFVTPQGTDACTDTSSLEKTTNVASNSLIKEENPSLKVSACETLSDSATVSLNILYKSENDAKKDFDSVKGVRLHWDLNTVMDDWELPAGDESFGSKGNNTENISSEGLQGVESGNLVSDIQFDNSANAQKLPNSSTSNISVSPPQLKNKLNNLYSGSSSEGRINTLTKLTMRAGEDLCGKNVKLEKQDDILVDPVVSNISERGMLPIKSEHEPIKLCEVPNVRNIASKLIIPADTDNLLRISDRAILPTVLSDNITIAPSVTTLDVCQPVIISLKKENDICSTKVSSLGNSLSDVEMKDLMAKSYEQFCPPKISTLGNLLSNVDTPKIDNPVNHSPVAETKELMPKFRVHSGEIAIEDPLGDGDVSDLSLGGHNHSVSQGKETKYLTGYESPIEDGEVRDEVSWEENECETDCVDYDIDDRDGYEYGTDNLDMLEANEEDANFIEKGTCESANSLKDSNTSASVENVSGLDQITMTIEANNSKAVEMVISDSIRRLDTKGSFTKEIKSRTTRAHLSSPIGESAASGPTDEKDDVFIQQHRSGPRFQAGQVFRGNKYLEGDGLVPQMQDERRKNNWNGSSSSFLNSRNNFSNKYQRGGAHSLQRSTVPDSETDDYHDQRQSTNYSAKGNYRPVFRKRPLDDSDKDFSPQRRNVESRVDGHGMNRGRSGTYHREGGFRGPFSNDSAPSSGFMQIRRRRSSSPVLNRNPSFSRSFRRSRSRSRTKSPIPWRMQEERNKRPYKYDSKFEENGDAFCSPPRKRFSSQGNSGSFSDRNGGPFRFRERNEGFRPGVHPQRFSRPPGEVWRGHNHNNNNNNERTKYSDRNEMNHRGGRQSGNNGVIRRFRNDEDDSFDGHNNRNNKGWEGRGSFKYDRERN